MILAGDIGGTHARLAFFDVADDQFHLVSATVFPSREYASLDEIVVKFVESTDAHPDSACFGIAGPVKNGRVETSNLPWVIEAAKLAAELKISQAILLNDLEANAWGIPVLQPKDVVCLNQVRGEAVGNQAVIAAGTGLGQAGMFWDGSAHRVFASEGGHTDFAPNNDLEMELLRYLRARFGHVSNERVLSGPGFLNVFQFLRDSGYGKEPKWLTEEMAHSDPSAVISRAGIHGECALCEQAVDLFISVYGAEAGNLALKVKATGGIFLGGGIAPKLLPKLTGAAFMKAFLDKGRMRPLLEDIPVKVITNDSTALLGAARRAVAKPDGPALPSL
ncbi:MAG: glucokinase [Acidobacteria bacterium]|jgi:glucokinase|nr:glucokinase [Acidobacteriota bacterium]